jgi:hypothetical protein
MSIPRLTAADRSAGGRNFTAEPGLTPNAAADPEFSPAEFLNSCALKWQLSSGRVASAHSRAVGADSAVAVDNERVPPSGDRSA